jgi:hypothetical protein
VAVIQELFSQFESVPSQIGAHALMPASSTGVALLRYGLWKFFAALQATRKLNKSLRS